MKCKKTLLLGGTGLLGSCIKAKLINNPEYELLVPTRAELNLFNFEEITKLIEDFQPEIIINAAGYNYVDLAETNSTDWFLLNSDLPKILAISGYKLGAKVIQFSSDYVFDGEKVDGYLENEPRLKQLNKYGESKALGELNVENFTDNYFIIRISWLFGTKEKPNFVKSMLNLARENKPITVVDDQFGKPTFSEDVVRALMNLIEENYNSGTYHLPNEESVSWYDFAKDIFKIANLNVDLKPIKSNSLNRPAVRPRYSALLNSKFPVLRSHKDALAEYLNIINI